MLKNVYTFIKDWSWGVGALQESTEMPLATLPALMFPSEELLLPGKSCSMSLVQGLKSCLGLSSPPYLADCSQVHSSQVTPLRECVRVCV